LWWIHPRRKDPVEQLGGHEGCQRVIKTIIVKTVEEETPISTPTFRMTSSINPRVFINTPRAPASRQPIPVSRAAMVAPPGFPIMATAETRAHITQGCQLVHKPTFPLSPVKAKNNVLPSCEFAKRAVIHPGFQGIGLRGAGSNLFSIWTMLTIHSADSALFYRKSIRIS
jgi:hypothetical protein